MAAAVGDLVRGVDGAWMVRPPTRCAAGHELGPNRVVVLHQPCGCGGHTTWCCVTCGDATYSPSLTEGCRVLAGPAAVRVL